MHLELDKINPNFRNLTDILFFTDRQDIDFSNYKYLYSLNKDAHYIYIIDRFEKSTKIFWENSSSLWQNRIKILFALEDLKLIKNISLEIESNLVALLRKKVDVNIKYNVEYAQYIELCKIRFLRKESLSRVRNYLLELPTSVPIEKVLDIITCFIPFVFKDLNDFANAVSKKVIHSIRNIQVLKILEAHGINHDKEILINTALSILIEKSINYKNVQIFFSLINDPIILNRLIQVHTPVFDNRLLLFFKELNYKDFEECQFLHVKNSIKLSPNLIEQIQNLYADKLYMRGIKHAKANCDKLAKLIRTLPEADPKTLFVHLSNNNRLNYIKYMFITFPDLKKLSVFI